MRTIDQVLDRAKTVQKVPSDYKLALCTGIGERAISNYRHGRSFPDEKACQKLAVAMGEDPIILMVEMQAQRTKDDSARAMWMTLAKRLQMGVSSLLFSCVLAIISIAASAMPSLASPVSASAESSPTVYYVKSLKQALCPFLDFIVKIGKFALLLGFRRNIPAL